jgi:hypothetical protein
MIEIKKLGVISVGKMLGLLYAILGLIFGAIFSCVSLIGAMAAFTESGGEALGLLFGVGSIIFLPIIYGLMGFVTGLVVALIYNLIARFVGGIEFYTE